MLNKTFRCLRNSFQRRCYQRWDWTLANSFWALYFRSALPREKTAVDTVMVPLAASAWVLLLCSLALVAGFLFYIDRSTMAGGLQVCVQLLLQQSLATWPKSSKWAVAVTLVMWLWAATFLAMCYRSVFLSVLVMKR